MLKLFRKLLPLLLIGAVVGAYYLPQNPELITRIIPQNAESQDQEDENSEVVMTTSENIGSVLSSTVQNISNVTRSIIDKMTDEQEEALINQTVKNLSTQIKDLPREQVEKIKYQFCQDVIEEYEQENSQE